MSQPVRRIVVGFDESDGSRQAVAWVAPTAAALGAEVVVVRAYSPLDELDRDRDQLDFPSLRDAAARRLAEVGCRPLAEAGVAHRAELVEDEPPHDVLCRACTELDADLLVVGSHGEGGWKERLLGSVASKLLAAAPCPVTVVPQTRAT